LLLAMWYYENHLKYFILLMVNHFL
jgi:hypothetical protein